MSSVQQCIKRFWVIFLSFSLQVKFVLHNIAHKAQFDAQLCQCIVHYLSQVRIKEEGCGRPVTANVKHCCIWSVNSVNRESEIIIL